MRVTRIELRDIGPFDDAVLELPAPTGPGELVLFEGPNGSGKTTIAESLAVCIGADSSDFDPIYRPDRDRISVRPPLTTWKRRRRGAKSMVTLHVAHAEVAQHVSVRTDDSGGGGYLHWNSSSIDPNEPLGKAYLAMHSMPSPINWAAFAFRGHARSANLDSDGPKDIEAHPLAGALAFGALDPASDALGQFLTNIEFERIQARVYVGEKPHNGSIDYARIAAAREATIRRFERAMSEMLDRSVTVDFEVGKHAPRVLFDGELIPMDLLGEGLRNTAAWLSDLLVRLERISWEDAARSPLDQDFWLVLDEIEESLHPRMQARILPTLRALFPNARLYATTHSPFVVASAGEGTVVRLEPDPKTHRISGRIEAIPLHPGQSLEWVVSAVFDAPSGFVDEPTRTRLAQHERGVRDLRANRMIDWQGFLEARDFLIGLNEEVRAIVSMREVPVRGLITEKLRERAA